MKYTMILTLLVLLCPRLSAARVESFFFQQQDCVQEKLYLTTDRPTYEAGDTVWFSGTLVSADNLSYLLKSNYIYAELIDEYGVVLQRRKVKREGLCFQHNFPLDKTLTTGRYTLRAYTSWMRNFGEALFYAGTISVRNPELPAGERPLQPYDVEVTFCPEGGALLAGQRQWVAFRAVGNDGRPAQVTGTLRVGAETIAFSSTHDGMGRVLLSAVPEVDSLVVQVQTAPGERPWQQRLKLPVARRGRALAVESPGAGDSVRYQILTAGVEDDSLLLVLHSGARLVTRRIVHGAEQGVLDLSACRVGVNQLLLCGADGVVYARRLLFRYPAQEARLALTASPNIGASVAPRSPLRLDLTLTDEQGRPLAGDFSVSVLDGDFVTTEQYVEAPTLQSHLLLSSDLHGRIYRPAQYFDAQVPRSERRQWLDLVMMTHGWSRFATDTLAPRSDWQMAHPLEEHEWVSGRITRLWDRKDRNRLERIPISIVDTSGHSWGTAMLDTAGYFFVGDLDYPLGTALMVRILSYSSKPHYHFDRPSYPEVSAPAEPYRVLPPAAVEDSAYRVWLRQLQRGDVHLLDEVVVTEKLPGFGAIRRREQIEAQLLSQEYDQYTYPKAMDLVNEVIRTRGWRFLDEVDVFEPGQKGAYAPHLVLRNVKHRMYSPVEALQKLYSEDILKIDLVRRHESYVIVTFKPGTELSDLVRNRRHFTYYAYGYQQPEYFYHPRYETEAERLSPTPDLRRTLYWNPSLQPDAAGRIALSFYTADHTLSRCLVHVEGVTFDGRPVSLLKEI